MGSSIVNRFVLDMTWGCVGMKKQTVREVAPKLLDLYILETLDKITSADRSKHLFNAAALALYVSCFTLFLHISFYYYCHCIYLIQLGLLLVLFL